jgi:hypothetical protein
LRSRYRSALVEGLLLILSSSLYAQVDPSAIPEANPARPTVSTPATLTPAGYLQFENGALYAATSPEFSKRLGINQVTKLSVDSRVQFLALSEPFTHSTGAAVSGNRPGEVFAGMQAGSNPAWQRRKATDNLRSISAAAVCEPRARTGSWHFRAERDHPTERKPRRFSFRYERPRDGAAGQYDQAAARAVCSDPFDIPPDS